MRDGWQYVRDPLPSRHEDPGFERIRRRLNAGDTRWQLTRESLEQLPKAIQRVQLQQGLLPGYGERFNPLLRCIVRRTRAYLEATLNPATGSYFLPKVRVRWVGDELARRPEFAGLDIGLYPGSHRSGWWRDGTFQRCDLNVLKERIRAGDLKLLLGTDAASEGLNLQRLGTLINIDLPWNPTRLEQRKGRIQRIGQARDGVWIANLRYRDSVEDRVHQVLADRLEAIHDPEPGRLAPRSAHGHTGPEAPSPVRPRAGWARPPTVTVRGPEPFRAGWIPSSA